MGSPCLFTHQRALKMGYFYWLRVKNSNHLLTELSLGYLELTDGKFYLESKASFIDIGSIASFKLFLIAWLRECCTFLDCSEVSLKSWPCSKYTQLLCERRFCPTRNTSKRSYVPAEKFLLPILKYVDEEGRQKAVGEEDLKKLKGEMTKYT